MSKVFWLVVFAEALVVVAYVVILSSYNALGGLPCAFGLPARPCQQLVEPWAKLDAVALYLVLVSIIALGASLVLMKRTRLQ